MHKQKPPDNGLTKREFLKCGLGGGCALALAGISPKGQQGHAQTARRGFVRHRRSPWFTATADRKIECTLCPKSCTLSAGQTGICRVRQNRNGNGYTLAYGNPALVQEDPIERKPFFHVLPGSRALSVSTVGCNLECKFCEVWDMALAAPEEVYAYDMPPKTVIKYARAAQLRSISYAFGEPVVFYEYMAETAELAKEAGLLNLLHTAGYIQPRPLKQLSGLLGAANVDLKSFEPAFYRDVCGGELKPVLNSLAILKEAGVHLEITTILIPTLNDNMQMIARMCEWIKKELGTDVPIHFARFYPLYKLTNLPQTPVSTLDQARKTAHDIGLEYVYIARVTGHDGENTFCPGCKKKVIERIGFVIDNIDLEDGKCRHCNAPIPGKWA